jgi:hypothetical protein
MTWQTAKTECKHGHPFTPENTRIGRNGRRQCIECGRVRSRVHQRKRRAERRQQKKQPPTVLEHRSGASTEPQEVQS